MVDVGGGAGKFNVKLWSPSPLVQLVVLIVVRHTGGFELQLCRLYPDLKFIVQDRAPVLKQAKQVVWPKENPSALAEGRVTFVEHDFFQPNPVRDAEVYWLRYIL